MPLRGSTAARISDDLSSHRRWMKELKTICDFQMTGISVSPGADQLVIIHLQGGNDLVLCLQSVARSTGGSNDRVGELVGTLCRLWLS